MSGEFQPNGRHSDSREADWSWNCGSKANGDIMEESFVQIKQQIIDEYERRNSKLADCLKTMESLYDKQKAEFQRKQSGLEVENRELRKKLDFALNLGSKPKDEKEQQGKDEIESRRVKFNMMDSNTHLVQELEAKIKDLTQELQKKDELAGYRRKRDEWARMKLEAEVRAAEVSLQGDDLGETSCIVKMLRKLQKDLERESWSSTGGSTESLDKDVQVLLDNVEAAIRRSGETTNAKATSRGESSKKDESSQANGLCSPHSDRSTRIALSPRSPASPTSPKSPKMTTAVKPGTAESHKPAVTLPSKDANSLKTASALMEMQNLYDEDGVGGGGGGGGGSRPDIKQMLSSIDANIRVLLESERKRAGVPPSENAAKPTSPPQTTYTKSIWKR